MTSTYFILKIRPLNVGDLSKQAPFLPDPDEYAMYLDGLREDISLMENIDSVIRDDSTLEILTLMPTSEAGLRTLLRHLFGNFFFDKLRYVSLAEA